MVLSEITLCDILSQGPGAEQPPTWGKVGSEYQHKPHNCVLFYSVLNKNS